MKTKLTVTNRSEWPSPAIKVLAEWIVKEAGIAWDYSILVRSCRSQTWGGRGGRRSQRIWFDRRYRADWPLHHKDHRFGWSHVQEYRTRMEVLVMLIAHEAYHATGGHPERFKSGDRINRASMEYRCNKFADETIVKLRVEWPALRCRIYKAMRLDRQKQATVRQRKADARGPERKLQLAQQNLTKWESKAKRVQTALRKYRRKVKYYEGRMAAKS